MVSAQGISRKQINEPPLSLWLKAEELFSPNSLNSSGGYFQPGGLIDLSGTKARLSSLTSHCSPLHSHPCSPEAVFPHSLISCLRSAPSPSSTWGTSPLLVQAWSPLSCTSQPGCPISSFPDSPLRAGGPHQSLSDTLLPSRHLACSVSHMCS